VHLFRYRYGAYLSKAQVAELVVPHPDTLELVHSWLKYHGVPSSSVSTTHGGSWLTLTDVPVSKANDILGASYQLYRHTETNETIVRTVGYWLPEALDAHVRTVAPTTRFASPRMLWQTTKRSSNRTAAGLVKSASGEAVRALSVRDTDEVNPDFTHWLYNTFAYEPVAMDRNKLGVAGYSGEYPNPSDLEMFMDFYHGLYPEAAYNVVDVNYGGYDPSKPGLEANLDVQYAEVMTFPTPITYYSVGKGPFGLNDPYLFWLYFVLDEPNVPQTISTSYADYEKIFPREYAIAVCDLFAELGARGVTILFASGDKGVDGKGDCMIDGKPKFLPTFPASCTYDGFL
jgi:tripeptidyl-peptidase-1